MSKLFSPLRLRQLTFKNRIFISPMCQYSSIDGAPTDWHLVHLGSRAVGGAALIIQEATGVSTEGRISPSDAGIWNDEQVKGYKRITKFIKENGSIAGIQLAHAGRKASTYEPWNGNGGVPKDKGGWTPVAPSPIAFNEKYIKPDELSEKEIENIIVQFVQAAKRSLEAGYEVAEVHAAHGYLLHEFLSPLSNKRTDKYGGSLENRMRLVLEISAQVRKIWPQELPVFVRISASDWVDGGWDVKQSTELCKKLKDIGIDLIDVSSGGLTPDAKIVTGPGYQVPFAAEIKKNSGILVGSVGEITEAKQAEEIISSGKADTILIARESLRSPYWPLHAAHELGVDLEWLKQYERAKPKKS